VDLPAGRGRSGHSLVPLDCAVMLTAATEVLAAADGPGSAESAWAWVSPVAGGTGAGWRDGLRTPASWPHTPIERRPDRYTGAEDSAASE
jgi:hypothetical protein